VSCNNGGHRSLITAFSEFATRIFDPAGELVEPVEPAKGKPLIRSESLLSTRYLVDKG
jgi:hypothetical protein